MIGSNEDALDSIGKLGSRTNQADVDTKRIHGKGEKINHFADVSRRGRKTKLSDGPISCRGTNIGGQFLLMKDH